MSILIEAGGRAGLQGVHRNDSDETNSDGTYNCMLEWVVTGVGDQTNAILGLSESQPTPESSCAYEPLAQFELTTFHGYSALTYSRTEPTHVVNGMPYTYQQKGLDWCMHRGGRNYYLMVSTSSQSIERFGAARDPAAIGDVFLGVVDERLPLGDASEPSPGVSPGESVPGQPSTPIDSGGLFDVPLPILLANLGIPAAGALVGAVLSALMGARPAAGTQKEIEGPPWPGALEALKSDLEEIDRQLKASGYYVTNKLQADPVLIGHGLEEIVNFGSDVTTGSTGATCHGYVGAVDSRVRQAVQNRFPGARVEKRRFVELSTLNAENKLADAGELLDAVVDDGHILHKLIVDPNKPQEVSYAIDFHGHNAKLVGKAPPILRPYAEPVAEWAKYLGLDQFMDIEYVDKVEAPKPTAASGEPGPRPDPNKPIKGSRSVNQ